MDRMRHPNARYLLSSSNMLTSHRGVYRTCVPFGIISRQQKQCTSWGTDPLVCPILLVFPSRSNAKVPSHSSMANSVIVGPAKKPSEVASSPPCGPYGKCVGNLSHFQSAPWPFCKLTGSSTKIVIPGAVPRQTFESQICPDPDLKIRSTEWFIYFIGGAS